MAVRFRRRLGVLVSVVAIAVLGAVSVTGAAAAGVPRSTPQAVASGVHTGYAIIRPVCSAPRPGRFTCMAYKRVDVAKGTPGAVRYSIPNWARGPAGGLTPAALATAYWYNPKGRGQTVAVVDWFDAPTIRGNLAGFDRHYHLRAETAASFRVVNQSGAASPLPRADPDSSVEISLDVEAVRAVCNECRIVLVEASQPSLASIAVAENTAVRLGAQVVSNSFGMPEDRAHPIPASDYRAFQHPNVVTVASAGDGGWYFWDVANEDQGGYRYDAPQSAAFPSSLSNVVAVGGTRLTLTSTGQRASETVWNTDGADNANGLSFNRALGASGGGCSVQFPAAGWQTGLAAYRASHCHGKRLAVDVSAVGDPATGFDVLDTYGLGGWTTVGGTSLSAPLIAGMWALDGGPQRTASPVRVLYENYHFRKPAAYDVTVGGTSWCGGATTASCSQAAQDYWGLNNPNAIYNGYVDCSFPKTGSVARAPAKDPECNAVTGYDGPSGVGAPRNLALFRPTTPTITVAAGATGRTALMRMTIGIKLPGSSIVRRSWTFGDGRSAVTAGNAVTHVYRRAGAYRVVAVITDNVGQTAFTVHTVRVG